MRNKNLILFLLGVFALICANNIRHTYNSLSKGSVLDEATYEEKKDYIEDSEWMKSYRNSQKNAMGLGLDLQGGMFVTMEVGVDQLIKEKAGNPTDKEFIEAMKLARIQKEKNSQANFVDLFFESFMEVNPKGKLSSYFANPEQKINFSTPNEEIVDYLKKEADAAIDMTFGILRTRIDQFGVTSPSLQLVEGTGRILIELPGVKDPEKVVKLLRGTAKLEFWETYSFTEGHNELLKLNDVVKRLKAIGDTIKTDSSKGDSGAVATKTSTDSAGTALDSAGIAVSDSSSDSSLVDSTLTDDEKREKFLADYPLFEFLSFPSQEGLNSYPNTPNMGYMRVSDTSKFNAWMRHPEVKAVIPNEVKFLWGAKSVNTEQDILELVAIKTTAEGKAPLGGEVITDATNDFDQSGTNQPIVNMKMNVEGARIWKDMTTKNKGKSIAIVMDDLIYSYPRVNNPISGGSSQIEGSFTPDEAEVLATLLRSGQLPVKANIEGKQIIGPTLGAENISSGIWSFFIAFIATIIFMFLYYSSAGLVAIIALLCNLFFILGVSAALGVVLTLPGIAAVVLTMGMAVDANVLIFERIREEQAHGKSLKASILSGFNNAFSSVMDANITTFLTGVVLFAFGVGPIKGFAVNLMIGIATSLISALFITRLILEYRTEKGSSAIKFGSEATTKVFQNINIGMVGKKKLGYAFSTILVVLSVVSIMSFGFKTGVDFEGGRQYEVRLAETPNVEGIRDQLTTAFGGVAPVIKTIGAENAVLITTSYLVSAQDKGDEVLTLLKEGVNRIHPDSEIEITKEVKVGPTVANDIKRSAYASVAFSLIIIFLYIFIRFQNWQFSLGALAALIHDVVITLGFFSIIAKLDFLSFSLEVDQAFIAAILTIVGYSINDTVVVFDRIRENRGELKSRSLTEIFDVSINQTISRTLITSLTTLVTILILFFLGGGSIKGFMFALLIGIIIGTYSSIFVASPISLDLLKATDPKESK